MDRKSAASNPELRVLELDRRHGWRKATVPGGVLYASGDPAAMAAASSCLAAAATPNPKALAAALASVRGFWAIVAESDAGILAAVDHVRSLPIFHARTSGGLVFGDDARAVAGAAGLTAIDPIAVEDLALGGYAMGSRTLIEGLQQLEAGEVAIWPRGAEPSRAHHHEYRPPEADDIAPVPTRELGVALGAAIDRLIRKAAGRPVGVPLSGGLDSRFVLASLAERAYRPLFAFSYGPNRNSDAVIASLVAARLGVDWQFISTPAGQIRNFFHSEERREYWRYADGLAALPSMQDVNPIGVLRRSGAIPPDAMIVNGNSGDFISGAHISPKLLTGKPVSPTELLDAIVDKHFALWRNLVTPERRRSVQRRIAAAMQLDPAGPPMTPAMATSTYERHEYAERQSKFVVNGQRSYEWHGLAWDLPLWDRDVVELFARVPLADRARQSLYRRYLWEWDYRGVFSAITRPVTAWPRLTSALLAPAAVGLRLAVGRERRDRVFRYLNYFDRFGDHYKAFGFREFAREAGNARNPAALYVRAWLGENGVDIGQWSGA